MHPWMDLSRKAKGSKAEREGGSNRVRNRAKKKVGVRQGRNEEREPGRACGMGGVGYGA